MALLIAAATCREIESIQQAGWKADLLSPLEFRRFFLRDPGYIEPGTRIAFVALNYSMVDVLNALGNGNDVAPPLRLSDNPEWNETTTQPRKGA